MVRARSTVENTRSLLFNLFSDDRDAVTAEESDGDSAAETETETETEAEADGAQTPASTVSTPRARAGVTTDVDCIYENTIVAIGERFGGVL